MAEPVRDVGRGEGFSVGHLDAMGEGPGFRKVRRDLDVKAFGVNAIVLHNREGGAVDNIKKTYDEVNAPDLVALKGKVPQGTWTLTVDDKEKQDTGRIRSFTLEMKL